MLNSGIRQLYKPLQPTIKSTNENVIYREFFPSPQLETFIYCYWELKTSTALSSPFIYRVVADGCIDIYFEIKNPEESYVMGFCRSYTEFLLGNQFHYFGIRFLPTMFPQLFKVDATQLSNRYQDLKSVVPDLAKFINSAFEKLTDSKLICDQLNKFFTNYLAHTKIDADNRLYEAIDIILKKSGMVQMEKDLATGISSRQLRRLFEYYIGDTPKTFCKVVRFQNILRAKPSTQSLRENKLFFDAGYYDQAHFIKEFKNFYGVTPAKAFGR